MTRRMLFGWTITGLLMAGSPLTAKPPELPVNPATDGKVPTPLEQEHFQNGQPGEPKRLPAAILDGGPGRRELPTAVGAFAAALSQMDSPIRLAAAAVVEPLRQLERAKTAHETAESLFKSCDTVAARKWYKTVVELAPGSDYAQNAEKRLTETTVSRFGDFQTPEPPFADKEAPAAAPDLSALQLKVLWEAARQYRDAVAEGNKTLIDQTARTLDAVLKQTKSDK